MKAEYIYAAMEKVGNANTLINIVSRRVRQLNAGGGGISRPLVIGTENQGAGDIALREIIEGKLGWEVPPPPEVKRLVNKRRPKR